MNYENWHEFLKRFERIRGGTIGGHLISVLKIYMTAEIVLVAFEDIVYGCELPGNDSGYAELVVYKK